MPTRAPFGLGEWYHCYGRGVDKRKVFLDSGDYERFLLSIHVGNGPLAVHISNVSKNKRFEPIIMHRLPENPEPDFPCIT